MSCGPNAVLSVCNRFPSVESEFQISEKKLDESGAIGKKLQIYTQMDAKLDAIAEMHVMEDRLKEMEAVLRKQEAMLEEHEREARRMRRVEAEAVEKFEQLQAARWKPVAFACAKAGASSVHFLTVFGSALLDVLMSVACGVCGTVDLQQVPTPTASAAPIMKEPAPSPPLTGASVRCGDSAQQDKQQKVHLECTAKLENVDSDTAIHAEVTQLAFGSSLGSLSKDFALVSISRVQNKHLKAQYEAKKSSFLKRWGSDEVNEKLLFHGTGKAPPDSIALSPDGFMVDTSISGPYGQGWYFTTTPSYSHNYSHFSESPVGERLYRLLICRVACGRVKQMGREVVSGMSRRDLPPDKYDSVEGGPHGSGSNPSMVCAVYEGAQACPEFLVTYRRKSQHMPRPASDLVD